MNSTADLDNREADDFYASLLRARPSKAESRMRSFFIPHSLEVASPLRALFVGQFRSVEFIKRLSPVLARDGLLSLMAFFRANPDGRCLGSGARLYVNARFSPVIPKAWRKTVGFYSIEPFGEVPFERDIYLILSVIDEHQCSIQRMESWFRAVRSQYGSRFHRTRVHVVVLPLFRKGFMDAGSAYYFKALLAIEKHFGPRIQHLTIKELLQKDLSGSRFIDLNQFDFYYTESFVTHHLLTCGSRPMEFEHEEPSKKDADIWLQASLHHGYRLNRGRSQARASPALRAYERFLASRLYLEEERRFNASCDASFTNGEKFCPLSFEKATFALASDAGV